MRTAAAGGAGRHLTVQHVRLGGEVAQAALTGQGLRALALTRA